MSECFPRAANGRPLDARPVAELCNVTMSYGMIKALEDVTLQLFERETVALLGPNGAGKSTAIGLLTGLKQAQQGHAFLFGRDPRIPTSRIRIGVTPQEAAFPFAWRVDEILGFASSHYVSPQPLQTIVEAFDLGGIIKRTAAQLSGGQQRKLAVALAFCGNPKAVFLDEPTTGLDIDARASLWRYIKDFRNSGGAVLLSTHYLEEAEMLADRVVLMNQGTILRTGTVKEVKGAVSVGVIRFDAPTAPTLSLARLRESSGNRHTYLTNDADKAVSDLVGSGVAFSSLEVLPASLSEAVRELLASAA
jgi:ABC-2 type transport system ATP-binding protein